jgi:hypothetical protein
MTLDVAGGPLAGGTITVNGLKVTVPKVSVEGTRFFVKIN